MEIFLDSPVADDLKLSVQATIPDTGITGLEYKTENILITIWSKDETVAYITVKKRDLEKTLNIL